MVACEFSGIVREAFINEGHDAWSCDLLPTEQNGQHLQCDVTQVLKENWDLMIAHPPCTYLAVSGAAWFKSRRQEQTQALEFVKTLMDAPIPKIAIENPVSIISTRVRKPDQIIQPWMFGYSETKATCLWLKNLPNLIPTNIVALPVKKSERMKMHYLPPSPDRWKKRSRTYQGIAEAMAKQWG